MERTIQNIIDQHEAELNIRHCGSEADKIAAILGHYERNQNEALVALKEFREDVIVWLRSVGIILETVGNAATHGEKAARIRGLTEFIETSIQKVRDMRIESYNVYQSPSLWRSEYPVHSIMRENKEMKNQIERMRGAAKELNIDLPF